MPSLVRLLTLGLNRLQLWKLLSLREILIAMRVTTGQPKILRITL
uniref:Uncharacterized protein n=1 Tax=Rhizophora mucronata TaxID=61149 RepID=A0A2P2QKS0_RHIMU